MKYYQLSYRTLFAVIVYFCCSVFVSCDLLNLDYGRAPYLKTSDSQITLDADGKNDKIVFVNASKDWQHETNVSWITVNRCGDELHVSASPNNDVKSRICEIKITCNEKSLAPSIIYVTQNSSYSSISADANTLNFSEVEGAIAQLNIKSSGAWKISSIPEWVRSSCDSAPGSKTITLQTLSSNKTVSPRYGTLIISSDNESVRVELTQYGGSDAGCDVLPNHITTLCNGIAFDLTCGKNVAHYYRGYIPAVKAGIMTNDEIIYTLKHDFQRHLPREAEVVDFDGLNAGSIYYIYTLGVSQEGKEGELIKTAVATKSSKSNDPIAWIDDITYDTQFWYWDITMSATCKTYYMMSTESPTIANSSDVLQAFWIDDAIRGGYVTEYLNGGNWYQPRCTNTFAVWTYAKDAQGNFSGKIHWNGGSISASSALRSKRLSSEKPIQGVDHSGRKLNPNEYILFKMN